MNMVANHWEDLLVTGQWHWLPYFHPSEFVDRITGRIEMDPGFMDWLLRVRLVYNRPMVISSGYRTKDHPKEREKKQPGAHAFGQAADVRVRSYADGFALQQIAMNHGVRGIGTTLLGRPDDYIHLDMWDVRTEQVAWTYPGPQPWLTASSTFQKVA